MNSPKPQVDPKFDLVLERMVDLPAEKIWAAWTQPEKLKAWFCPKPWQTTHAEIDLRPGGRFVTTMRGPDGQEFTQHGCILEVVAQRKLVWTDALTENFRPSAHSFFTGTLLLEPQGAKTKYTAIGMHKDEESRLKHEQMGFQEGWAKALDQLIEFMKS